MTKHNLPVDERIRVSTEIDEVTGCWNWIKNLSHSGYGRLKYQGREWWAHRFVWTHLVGPIPDGLVIDHLCKNTRCVNPDHLEVVTQVENQHRARRIGYAHPNAPQRCRRGHSAEERSGAHCRACRRENQRRYSAATR